MRKKVLFTIVFLSLLVCFFPYTLIAKRINHHDFIAFMLSKAAVANSEIMQQRHHLFLLYHQFRARKKIKISEHAWLDTIAQKYKLPSLNFSEQSTWNKLIERVDIIPNSLVVAQAINESAWGKSRFAQKGNNYFGQWCYTKGCGLVPRQRAHGEFFEVRKFPSALSSVQSYMQNLNSNHLYTLFRTQRHILRLEGKTISGLVLASALEMYSIKRSQYVIMITDIIKKYDLQHYDGIPNLEKPKKQSGFDWF